MKTGLKKKYSSFYAFDFENGFGRFSSDSNYTCKQSNYKN